METNLNENLDNLELQDDKESSDLFASPTIRRLVSYTTKSGAAYQFPISQVINNTANLFDRPGVRIELTPVDVQWLTGIDSSKAQTSSLILFKDSLESVMFINTTK